MPMGCYVNTIVVWKGSRRKSSDIQTQRKEGFWTDCKL